MGYVASAVAARYLNTFLLVVQTFRNHPASTKLAPAQSEPPVRDHSSASFIAFVALGAAAARSIRREMEGMRRWRLTAAVVLAARKCCWH
jgi:hypothetical protein